MLQLSYMLFCIVGLQRRYVRALSIDDIATQNSLDIDNELGNVVYRASIHIFMLVQCIIACMLVFKIYTTMHVYVKSKQSEKQVIVGKFIAQ